MTFFLYKIFFPSLVTQISLNKPSSVVEQKILNKNEGVSVLSLLSEKEKNENFQ